MSSVLAEIHPEIHGALLGGLLAGLTVVLGVWLESWASNMRQRRAEVESAVDEVSIWMPHVLAPISDVWARDRPPADAKSAWGAERERVELALVRIRRKARWPMPDAKEIRAEAATTLAKFVALTYAYQSSKRVIPQEDLNDAWAVRLSELVFPGVDPVDEQMLGYVRRFRRGGKIADGPVALGTDE